MLRYAFFLLFLAACGERTSAPASPPTESHSQVSAAAGSMSSPRFRMTFELGAVTGSTTIIKEN